MRFWWYSIYGTLRTSQIQRVASSLELHWSLIALNDNALVAKHFFRPPFFPSNRFECNFIVCFPEYCDYRFLAADALQRKLLLRSASAEVVFQNPNGDFRCRIRRVSYRSVIRRVILTCRIPVGRLGLKVRTDC